MKVVEKNNHNAVHAIIYSIERGYDWIENEWKNYHPWKEFEII